MKKPLSPEEVAALNSRIQKGQDARDLLHTPAFINLMNELEEGCKELILGLRGNETEAFTFYNTKRDVLKDITNSLQAMLVKGEQAQEKLSGTELPKRGLI